MSSIQISKMILTDSILKILPMKESRKREKLQGVAGYHGPLANIIGWILEKSSIRLSQFQEKMEQPII